MDLGNEVGSGWTWGMKWRVDGLGDRNGECMDLGNEVGSGKRRCPVCDCRRFIRQVQIVHLLARVVLSRFRSLIRHVQASGGDVVVFRASMPFSKTGSSSMVKCTGKWANSTRIIPAWSHLCHVALRF